jgi:hypothetical protein
MTFLTYLSLSFGFSRSKNQFLHSKHNQKNVKANRRVERKWLFLQNMGKSRMALIEAGPLILRPYLEIAVGNGKFFGLYF